MVPSVGMEVEIVYRVKKVSFPPKAGSSLKTGTYRFPGVGQKNQNLVDKETQTYNPLGFTIPSNP